MKILLLEDNPGDAELTIRALKKNWPECAIEHVSSIKEAQKILASKPQFDIALLDMQLPDGNGLDILMEIREKQMDMAVAMLTGSGDEEVAVAALKAGADDYTVKKPGYTAKVPHSVKLALENHNQYLERKLKAIHVLYIEHNAADVDFTRRHLTRYAPYIRLTDVPDGKKALALLPGAEVPPEEWDYQLIVMDYRLPGMNALEIIKEIRQERKLDIPILIVTGQGNEEVAVQALKVGASDYLVKREKYLTRLPSLITGAFQNCELKRKQKALTASESKYRLLAENSGDVIFTLDFELNFTYVSPAVFKLRGFTVDEVLQQNIKDTLVPDSVKKVQLLLDNVLPAALAGNPPSEPVISELQTFRKDNSLIWVEVTATILYDIDGKPAGILGVTRDISKRKAAQEELRKLSRAVVQSADSIIITDKDGKIEYVNPKFTQLTGFEKEEVLGKNPHILNSGEQLKSYYKELWETILAGNDWYGEFHNKKKNGELYWERASISPLKNNEREITHFVAVKEDITERKKFIQDLVEAKEKAEENENIQRDQKKEIKLNNKRLESLLKISQFQTKSIQELLDYALKEAITLTKSKIGYIYFYNETTRQFILNTWSDGVMDECNIVNPQTVYDLDMTGCWGEAVRQRKPIVLNNYQEENPLKKGTPEGHVQLEKFLTIPVIFEGKIVAVAGVANKKTDYNDADTRQLTLLMDNVWKISERINLIDNLEKAREKAEESDRLKSAFLANMSHEIRTPMNGILGFTDLLLNPDLSSDEKDSFIKIIHQSGQRMLNTVTDIVEISKIEAGIVQIIKKETDVNKSIAELVRFFKPEAEKKGLQLILNELLPDSSKKLKTDQNKLDSILTNLIKNAIKYTDSGTINLGCQSKGSVVEFYVKDTGIGVPKNRQEAIFNRFEQADIEDTRVFEGSGLGLAIAKSYVEMLGGKIWVESKAGIGSTFLFTIPNKVVKIEMEGSEDKTTNLVIKAEQTLKVLIAEDDEASFIFLKTILSKNNIKTIHAVNGLEAVIAIKENPDISLVLMDIKMPVMSGIEATLKMRQFNQTIPIIAQTAYALPGEKEKIIEAGCNDLISKPIRQDELINMIFRYTSHK